MNTAVVLPAVMLGRAIDAVLAIERGEGDATTVGLGGPSLVGVTLLVECSRIFKRMWLITGRISVSAAICGLMRCVAFWPWPAERLHQTPVGDLMARIDGDVETWAWASARRRPKSGTRSCSRSPSS